MRRRKGKRFRAGPGTLAVPTRANQMWTMDFTRDSLASGRKFRTLNLMDGYTREALWIEVDNSLPGLRVVRVLERVAQERGLRKRFRWTTDRSSSVGLWTSGPSRMAWRYTLSIR
jgi:putative transposase